MNLNLSKNSKICLISDFVTSFPVGLRIWMDILKDYQTIILPSVLVTGAFSNPKTQVKEIEGLVVPEADCYVLGYVPQPYLWQQVIQYQKPIIWDPIFMDNGRRYPKLNENYPEFVRAYASSITLALPNFDEAQCLDFIDDLIITGVQGKVCFHEQNFDYPQLAGQYPGAGDYFTAYFVRSLLDGLSIEDSIKNAIENTYLVLSRLYQR